MPYEWVSVHEASRRLGRSVSTIRRQIESGELVGEREPLARGSTRDRYRVRLDATPAQEVTHHGAPPSESSDAPEPRQDAPALTPLTLNLLDDVRRLATENAELRERVGRAETAAAYADRERQRADDLADTLIALRASLSAKEREAEAARAEAAELRTESDRLLRRSWWGRLWNR